MVLRVSAKKRSLNNLEKHMDTVTHTDTYTDTVTDTHTDTYTDTYAGVGAE